MSGQMFKSGQLLGVMNERVLIVDKMLDIGEYIGSGQVSNCGGQPRLEILVPIFGAGSGWLKIIIIIYLFY